ncbi:MAG: ATP-binding protein, partial [Methanoregula sp.]
QKSNGHPMIDPFQLRRITADQIARFKAQDTGIPRRINPEDYRERSRIVVISGVRRCGKSTLLKQLSCGYDPVLYLNCDDDRLVGADTSDLAALLGIWEEIYPGARTVFLDEIQNIPGWERVVRRMHDEGYHIFLTGSNSHLLSIEFGTHLTGRYIQIELFPFGFDEICRFAQIRISHPEHMTTRQEAGILRLFSSYLEDGGFPEYQKDPDPEILRRTFDDIIFRDIISRYKIREIKAFRELARYLFTNLTHEASLNSLASVIGIKSGLSVKTWIGYLEDSYLLGSLSPYEYSMKQQLSRNQKYYGIDTGMRNAVAFRFSGDAGILLENLVWTELRRQGKTVYFWTGKRECDFLVMNRGHVQTAIQVCFHLTQENRQREIEGLVEVMERFPACTGLVVTERQDEILTVKDHKIRVIPFWRWVFQRDRIL